jgi:carboxypeptidase family protein
LLVIVLAGTMAACGGRSAPIGSGNAVVTGTVTAGPTCPVERAASPCPDRAVQGASVQADRGGHVVAEALTDTHGHYALTVRPGVYTIIATNAGGYRSIARRRVSLAAGERQSVDLVVDTGIR